MGESTILYATPESIRAALNRKSDELFQKIASQHSTLTSISNYSGLLRGESYFFSDSSPFDPNYKFTIKTVTDGEKYTLQASLKESANHKPQIGIAESANSTVISRHFLDGKENDFKVAAVRMKFKFSDGQSRELTPDCAPETGRLNG